jgi:tetratricopeptide (TPR) repeat protein
MGVGDTHANRISQALDAYAQALVAYQAASSRQGIANVQINLAQIETSLGRMHTAQDLLVQAAQTCREIGAGRLEGIARANLGVALYELGQTQDAYDTALEGLRLARISGESRTEAWAHHSAQQAAAGLGRFSDALTHAQAACVHFTAHNEHSAARHNASAAARHLQALDRQAEALAAADALLAEVAAEGGWREAADSAFEPIYNLHCVLAALGDGRAAALLDTAYRLLCAQADHLAAHVPRDDIMRSTLSARSLCAAWAAAQAGSAAAPG